MVIWLPYNYFSSFLVFWFMFICIKWVSVRVSGSLRYYCHVAWVWWRVLVVGKYRRTYLHQQPISADTSGGDVLCSLSRTGC